MRGVKGFFSGGSGYTLLEIAAVVAVTGTLALVAVPVVQNKFEQSKQVSAVESLKKICGAVSNYYADVSELPTADASTTAGQVIRTGAANADIEEADTTVTAGWVTGVTIIESGDVLTKNVAGKLKWNGPYLAEEDLKDPWGRPFYVTIQTTYTAGDQSTKQAALFGVCAGADGVINVARLQEYASFVPGSADYVIRIR